MTKKARRIEFEESSGNVFADLDLPNPEQELLKANLTLQIFRVIKARKLTQAKAGKILGIDLLDHVILAASRYWSFKEHEEL